jgi:hypothetical protein
MAGLVLFGLVWLLSQSAQAAAADCKALELKHVADGVSGAQVDQVWAGTRVTYAALAAGSKRFFGYYDSTRRLTISEYDLATGKICYARLDSVFGGWDSHNSVVLALDPEGYLHVAGNMHASPLVYARAARPGSIEGIRLAPMVGKDEERTTYPRFLLTSDGKFVFLYRAGGSGNGRWVVNQFVDGRWQRVHDALFGDRWEKTPVSAYPALVQGPDGSFHVPIVWRQRPDVTSNFAISYAKSPDLKTWLTHDGKPISLPITPDTADRIEWPGKGAGLLNSPKVSFDAKGQPVITYSRYGEGGRNAIIAARPAGEGWAISTIATADRQTPVVGKGSLPDVPRFSDLTFAPDGRSGTINVRFSGERTKRYAISADTLQSSGPAQMIKNALPHSAKLPQVPGLEDPRQSTVRVLDQDERQLAASLSYITQATHHDKPRQCTQKAPKACQPPPSPLYYMEDAGSEPEASEALGVD